MSRKNTKGTILAIDMGNTNIVIGWSIRMLSPVLTPGPTTRGSISTTFSTAALITLTSCGTTDDIIAPLISSDFIL